jgi:hypothetical protein
MSIRHPHCSLANAAAAAAGPLAVFGCGKELAYIYILAELLAALLACSIFGEHVLLL